MKSQRGSHVKFVRERDTGKEVIRTHLKIPSHAPIRDFWLRLRLRAPPQCIANTSWRPPHRPRIKNPVSRHMISEF
ncbi:MAG: hypothetical protein HY221_02050 [Candidatus Sungbacteria bacterium]|uniref:Uncharacterized protein n=1 Tax=Candidatus Sungiibacteriota bacterium TaxID=2750080 RepID=A0A932VR25_9BACT|nr:hypothetical protein [Candidatus Sungbacteria bacterium]